MVKWNIGIKVAAIDWWWVEILFVDMKTRLSGGRIIYELYEIYLAQKDKTTMKIDLRD